MFLRISAVLSYTRADVPTYSVLYSQNIWVTKELLQALEQQLPVTTQLKHEQQEILPQQSTARKKTTCPAILDNYLPATRYSGISAPPQIRSAFSKIHSETASSFLTIPAKKVTFYFKKASCHLMQKQQQLVKIYFSLWNSLKYSNIRPII